LPTRSRATRSATSACTCAYGDALKAAGLDERYGFHSLRHSYGTALAGQGVPMRTLQEWMGHQDIQTTQR